MQPLTSTEIELLEAEMRKLHPDFRMFDREEFMQVGIQKAAHALRNDKTVLDDSGRVVNIARLARRVVTDVKRECHGVPFAWWWVFVEMEILKGVIRDPWSEARWWIFEELRGKGLTHTMWGGQSTGKSSSMGRFCIVKMCVWGADATFYVTGPKKSHSDDKGWKQVQDWARHLARSPSMFSLALGITAKVNNHNIEINVADHGTATAKFVSAEESSTIRGKKSHSHDPTGMIGITCVIVDEFVENSNLDLKRINSNAASNYNFFMLLACNPDPDLVGHPSIRAFSWPETTISLDRTLHFRWPTAFGLCTRYAWVNCPNRILGKTRWSYLLDQIRVDRARQKGSTATDSEIDAFGFGSGARGAPLDENQIKLAGTYEIPIWQGPTTRIMAIDCAFGGQDPATAWISEAGPAVFRATDDAAIAKNVISSIETVTLPVTQSFTVTQEWIEEMDELLAYSGGSWPETTRISPVVPGMQLNGNYSMGYEALKCMREFQVPAGNVTFDSSQRGDCTSIMLDFLGRQNVSWYYEGSRSIKDEENLAPNWYKTPLEYERTGTEEVRPKLWSESVSSTISMLWFSACESIKRGFLVNGKTCKTGLEELCARPVVKRRGTSEGKKDVLSKDQLKLMGQKSPTNAEVICFGMYFATRFLGLIQLEKPKEKAVFVHVESPAFNQFIQGSRRAFTRYGPQQKEAPEARPVWSESTDRALAELNQQGLTPSQEANNRLYMMSLGK